MSGGEEIECTGAELLVEGIRCDAFDLRAAPLLVQHIQAERGWAEAEEVVRSTSKPQDEAEIVKDADEHCHLDDEVRLFLAGQALYDVRSLDGANWLRIWVGAGDLVMLPAKRYHRFLVGQASVLRYMQPYASRQRMMHLYRASEDRTRAF
jgi:1,2-dihydroxy-3-keto-5-methylthiopentene dioxygenase